jgi:hypothetical protein
MADDYGQLIAREVRPSNDADLPGESSQEQASMLFMVIERFAANDMVRVYQRVHTEGRTLHDGLEHVDSWVERALRALLSVDAMQRSALFQEWALKCVVRAPHSRWFQRSGRSLTWMLLFADRSFIDILPISSTL